MRSIESRWQQLSSDWKAIQNKDVAELNELMRKQGVPAIGIAKVGTDQKNGEAAH